MADCTCDVREPTHGHAIGRCGASKYVIYLDEFDDGVTTDPKCPFHGECFYARYRWGCLTWGFGASLNAAVDASIKGPALQLGDEYDGEMDTGTMLRHVGEVQSSERSTNTPVSAALEQGS